MLTPPCLFPLHRNTHPSPLTLTLLLLLCLSHIASAASNATAPSGIIPPATSVESSTAAASLLSTTAAAAFAKAILRTKPPPPLPPPPLLPSSPPPLTTTKCQSCLPTIVAASSSPFPSHSSSKAPPPPSQPSPSSPSSSLVTEDDGNDTQSWRGTEYDLTGDQGVNFSWYKRNYHRDLLLLSRGNNATFPAFIFEAGDDGQQLEGENETILGEILEFHTWSTTDVCLTILKAIVMFAIIMVSILGNVLVIVSVALHRRLHSTANYLLVSLATADMLVALCAMTFNASVELSGGRWIFGRVMCDLWNSFDVYFSTVSILHLCCISVDRYYAIVRPLEYPLTITRRILAIMLAHCWLAPTLISFLPIFLGWYTTAAHLQERDTQPHVCAFVVNAIFALVSSAVSFWVPCTVMVVMYYRIFQEARKQERALLSRASSASSAAYSASIRLSAASQQQQDVAAAAMARQQLLVALQATPFTPATRHQEFLMKTLSDTSSTASVTTTSSGVPSVGAPSGSSSSRSSSGGGGLMVTGYAAGTNNSVKANTSNGSNSGPGWRHSRHGSTASWHGPSRHGSLVPCGRRMHSTPVVTTRPVQPPVGRREHKAARTLGLIMGAFVLCWLPFFIWYVSINICGSSCRCPHAVVTALFWIGYFNSTLNPFIYAYFRTDFREAFHRTLKRLTCCRPRQPSGVFV